MALNKQNGCLALLTMIWLFGSSYAHQVAAQGSAFASNSQGIIDGLSKPLPAAREKPRRLTRGVGIKTRGVGNRTVEQGSIPGVCKE